MHHTVLASIVIINSMELKKVFTSVICLLLTMNLLYTQEISLHTIADLRPSKKLNHIYKLIPHKEGGLLLTDARWNGDLDALLIYFDLEGEILKEIRIGKLNSYERIVNISKYENGYYLLLNSVSQKGKASLLLYNLDNDLEIITDEEIVIEEMSTASVMIYNPINNGLEIVVLKRDQEENSYPSLVHYDLNSKGQSYLDLSTKSRVENKQVPQASGRASNDFNPWQSRQINHVNKECLNIQFATESCKEILLTGLENSSTITDFWVASIVDRKQVWEDRYPTELGGDEGMFTFKVNDEYLVFGHEYSKQGNSYYSYRTLHLDKNGKELSAKRFDSGKKDWFKGVIPVKNNHFLMFGQSQSVDRARSISEIEKIKSSNLWAVMVDERGSMVSDYLHKTDTIDKALAIAKSKKGEVLIVFNSNDLMKIGQLKVDIP